MITYWSDLCSYLVKTAIVTIILKNSYISSGIYTRFVPVKLFSDVNAWRKAISTRIMYLMSIWLHVSCPKTLFSALAATSEIHWSHESFRIASVLQRSREVGTFAERPATQLTICLTYGACDLMVPFDDLGNIKTHRWCHELDTSMCHCVFFRHQFILGTAFNEHIISGIR